MKLTLIAGVNRKEATVTTLLRYMQQKLEQMGAEVTFLDLHELQLPIFSPDSVEVPANVKQLTQAMLDADGIVLGTPEYHGSFSGVLKNALDYLSSAQFEGKPVLVASSAAGAVGVSSLTQLQTIVRNLHGINCPEWVSIGGDSRKFDENGEPQDEKVKQRVLYGLEYLARLVRQLRPSEK